MDYINKILCGQSEEVLRKIPSETVHTCITSPPYWGLRNYGIAGQLGQEPTPEEYADRLKRIFRQVNRVLRPDGTLWLNIGDSYFVGQGGKKSTNAKVGNTKKRIQGRAPIPEGCKKKDLAGIPWLVAFALREDGWYLRSDIIWHKPNAMPETVKDRPAKSYEHIFLLSKKEKYFYDHEAIKEPTADGKGTRTKRDVWSVPTRSTKNAHFATFPPNLIKPCVLAGSPEGGIVLDPFIGAGTTALVALRNKRNFIGIDLNPEYINKIALPRIEQEYGAFLTGGFRYVDPGVLH